MRTLNLQDIHQYSLGCLIYFDQLCRKYHLRYSLAYGSLLGAVRHKGFIPWDDDVDVMMPREDYNKLVSLFLSGKEKDRIYGFINEKFSPVYRYGIGRIVDKRTRIKFTNDDQNVDGMGVFIDVYPLDYTYDSRFARRLIYHTLSRVLHLLQASVQPSYHAESSRLRCRMTGYLTFLTAHLLGRNGVYRLYYDVLKLLPKKSDYVFDAWDLDFLIDKGKPFYQGAQEKNKKKRYQLPARYFDHLADYDFEGWKIKGFAAADAYLKQCYGDYMTLPSKEDQNPHHAYEAYSSED